MDFCLDYALCSHRWKTSLCMSAKTMLCLWLLTWSTVVKISHATRILPRTSSVNPEGPRIILRMSRFYRGHPGNSVLRGGWRYRVDICRRCRSEGVSCKQLIPAKEPYLPVYPKPSFSHSKYSGLSAVPPAALLDNKQFVVEPVTTRNVTTQVGMTTYLHCIVDKLEDKTVGGLQRQVSWIRLRDFHLLTVGLYTYTSDRRFQTIYNEYSTDWTLQIKFPQLSDEGLYECQVSSDPPASHHVYLKVLVPKTKILGGDNLYVSVGSEVNITCVITDCPEPPTYVFWYHGNRMINFDTTRGDIIVQKAGNDTAISRLRIRNAQPADSGNYSCCPSNAEAASIFVNVLRGEKHAAVQNDAASTSRSSRFVYSINILTIVQLVLFTVNGLCTR